ncbi:methyltransferase domain-containing protein [Desulfoprunum benzoelyticum]|uniref:FKBP-type peptidyl-prolyl cis-trans isomerase 2 n=1 Tax=Desulfoprunum benzoelyticum TaxID=1506996 RepID=A0A840UM47_9BACT|nr:methyltransferase domain-containing protein [Desulfoprunum benzoelyticum]MBB5347367.1 FKBP-type peptidyl-prolyl cis-trans isomerase 2 [Desulfoprunum benzoelyticum]MBM9530954.1 methyltransferase domain-containing protein [Desulfoprunum benzoelyticum]
MQRIDRNSRAVIEFTITWHDQGIDHQDRTWADPVSFWRDVIDPRLVQNLYGQGVGGQAIVDIPANRFSQPYNRKNLISIRPKQFRSHDRFGNDVVLRRGRFYPQGMLEGVDGVFRVSTAPCRYLGTEGDRLLFDLNHPLAGRDLRLQATVRAIHAVGKERGGRCEDWLERASAGGPGMQAPIGTGVVADLTLEDLQRIDERPDDTFYRQPRLVQHLDSSARREITGNYGRLIPAGARVLDLMGSWDSHLPDDLALGGLTVLGLNDEELRRNRRAGETLAHDLNATPRLPFADAAFDAVICTASIEYLTAPHAVVAEIRRVLRPGGLVAIAFSNRWFPPKAIRIWTELHEFERLGLVTDLLAANGGFSGLSTLSRRGLPRPDDDPHQELMYSDPVFMVWGQAC